MTQETSYFYQNQPASNTTKKKPTSGLLGRRQQNASYLQQLELPSLPPLSQMLTDKTDENKSKTAYNDTKKAEHANHNISSETDTTQHHHHTNPTANTTAAAAAAAAAGGVMPAYPPAATQVPSQPMYFGDYTMNSDPTTSSLEQRNNMAVPVVSTTNGAMLMDGTAGTFAPANMMPLDSMYPMSSALSTDPTAAVMAAAYMNNGGQRARQASSSSTSSTDKIYSFVAIPGTNQRKRPRRRYDEIERLYHCNWPGCTKAYGTLNHLNAHVSMQKHGAKRHPAEFKEMRKEWRRQKKDRDATKKAAEEVLKQQQMMQVPPPFSQQQAFQSAVYGQIPTGSMPLTGFY